jgi:hypothetical protein
MPRKAKFMDPTLEKANPKRPYTDWDANYSKLAAFYSLFGHCNISEGCPEYGKLGRWISKQRSKRDLLSPEKIEKLDRIGFVWKVYDSLWERNYAELASYRDKFGHCNVPKGAKGYEKLANWVAKQRSNRKGKRKSFTAYKISKLDSIGFEWEINSVLNLDWDW